MRKDDGPRMLPWGVKPNQPALPLCKAVRPAGLRLDAETERAVRQACKRSVIEG